MAIHVALTAIMAWWALVLALPADTFAIGSSFRVLAALASEDTWAMMFWAIANVGVLGLSTSSATIRLVSVFALSTMHGVLALCFLLANPYTTAGGTYSIIALLGYYLSWRRADEVV